jgi:hypothetical protein
MRITDLLQDPFGAIAGEETVSERQKRQFQLACESLNLASVQLSEPPSGSPDHYDQIIAIALVGLLAAQLSRQ